MILIKEIIYKSCHMQGEPKQKKIIRIVAISDTHDKHKYLEPAQMPPGDIFVHAGDFTRMSRKKQYIKFRQFLQSLPYKHKIVIPGNHDFALECIPERYEKINEAFKVKEKDRVDPVQQIQELKKVCTFLRHQMVEVQGLKIFASPYINHSKMMGFGYQPPDADKYWSQIPQGIDVLVTHGPPLGINDVSIHNGQNCGCVTLRKAVEKVQPKVHIFGHIHQGHGHTKVGNTDFYNVAFMDAKYSPANKPVVIEIEVKSQ